MRREVSSDPKDRGAKCDPHKLEEKQTTGWKHLSHIFKIITQRYQIKVTDFPSFRGTGASCKELNTSEVWYNAAEDLGPSGPAVADGMGRDGARDRTNAERSVKVA